MISSHGMSGYFDSIPQTSLYAVPKCSHYLINGGWGSVVLAEKHSRVLMIKCGFQLDIGRCSAQMGLCVVEQHGCFSAFRQCSIKKVSYQAVAAGGGVRWCVVWD